MQTLHLRHDLSLKWMLIKNQFPVLLINHFEFSRSIGKTMTTSISTTGGPVADI